MATGGRPAARAVRRHGIEPIFGLGVDRVNSWLDLPSPSSPAATPRHAPDGAPRPRCPKPRRGRVVPLGSWLWLHQVSSRGRRGPHRLVGYPV